jgi:hypothetical protein
MAYAIGSFSEGSTVNHSVTGLSFLPTGVRFQIGGRSGTNETRVQHSVGNMDGANQTCVSIFQDSTGSKTKTYTNRCINHFERVSGTITEKIIATFVSFNNDGGGVYGFTVNFTAADSNYPILFEAF